MGKRITVFSVCGSGFMPDIGTFEIKYVGHKVRPTNRSRPFRSRRGFALVITISLLAFLVLLLVVLASLTRVETGISRNTQDLTRARQNALVGLNIALGRLQAAAGPDQRVTATADIVGATNNRWTGVWDTVNMAGPAVWLVSGSAPNPNSAATGETLVGTNTAGTVAGNTIIVPTQDIVVDGYPGLSGQQTVGRFAWWVGDEGVKGRLDIRDTVDSVTIPASPNAGDPVTSSADRDRLRQLLQHRTGGDALPTLALDDEDTDIARWNGLTNVLTFNQLKFLYAPTTAQRNFLRDNFHDFTVHSRGLLANPAAGGLRSNVSDPLSPLTNAGITDLEAFRPSTGNVLSVFPGAAPLASPSAQVKPLITELALDVVLYREDIAPAGAPSGRLLMGYRVTAEFWNPYLLPIQHNATGTADYIVKFIGLPTVTVTAPLQSTTSVGDVDLNAILGGATTVDIDFAAPLTPGQFSRRVSVLTQAFDTGLIVSDATVPSGGAAGADDRLDLSAPASTVTVEFYSVNNPATPIARFENIDVPAFSRSGTTNWWIPNDEPFPGFTTTTFVVSHGISVHLRADPSRATWGDWVNPASAPYPLDLRFPSIPYDANFWESIGVDPVDSAQQVGFEFSAADPVFAFNKTLIAFDFPVQRQLSIGGLSSMSFPGARPLAVGSPWGGALNAAFDSAFFNPVQSSWTVGQPLPNSRHAILGAPYTGALPAATDVAGAGAAQFLAIEGAFNINSTSTNAWTALLGRTIRGWQPVTGANKKLANPFFTLGHSAQFGDPAVTGFPILGKRAFSDATIQQVATEMRTLIRARGAPFASMEEFVNSGVLQASIDNTGLNATQTSDIGSVPAPYTPNYLTQSGMLNTQAPLLAARSDTFTIRAFGSVINPVTGAENGRAWCEAIVQRVPETVATGGSLMANATGLGRRFKIVQFRWLGADDI
jgi:Tfp pilus assembly protein PilX